METLATDDLSTRAAPYNPRKISDHDLSALRLSLAKFGVVEPVVVNRRSGHVVGGHQRIKAARLEGLEQMPVFWVDLDAPEEKALNLALNRISGAWDDERLGELIRELDGQIDLALTGFGDKEIDKITRAAAGLDPDAHSIEVEAEQRCSTGNVWAMGDHRLVCGDSTKEATYRALLGNTRPDVCLTDPPYGIDLSYEGIDDTQEALVALAATWLPLAMQFAPVVVFSPGVTNQWHYPMPDWVICWFYGGGPHRSPWGFACWQPFLCYGKDPGLSKGKGARPDAVDMNIPSNAAKIDHPCPKPIQLWAWLIDRLSMERGEVVLDPFAGSGTTFLAAEQMGRVAFGIEQSPQYCDVIIARWESFTGQKAVKDA